MCSVQAKLENTFVQAKYWRRWQWSRSILGGFYLVAIFCVELYAITFLIFTVTMRDVVTSAPLFVTHSRFSPMFPNFFFILLSQFAFAHLCVSMCVIHYCQFNRLLSNSIWHIFERILYFNCIQWLKWVQSNEIISDSWIYTIEFETRSDCNFHNNDFSFTLTLLFLMFIHIDMLALCTAYTYNTNWYTACPVDLILWRHIV